MSIAAAAGEHAGGFDSAGSQLFAGLNPGQLECARSCLRIHSQDFARGEEILACQGGQPRYGVITSGVAFDVRRHANGERTLVDVIEPGDLLGDGWQPRTWHEANPSHERAAVGALPGQVLLIDPARLADERVSCPARFAVQNNLLRAVLAKEERLRAKLEILRFRGLRSRLGHYLLGEGRRRGGNRFTVPLNRSELAEYLHADRAAVSRELARMQEEGLISYHRNSFALGVGLSETALEPGCGERPSA